MSFSLLERALSPNENILYNVANYKISKIEAALRMIFKIFTLGIGCIILKIKDTIKQKQLKKDFVEFAEVFLDKYKKNKNGQSAIEVPFKGEIIKLKQIGNNVEISCKDKIKIAYNTSLTKFSNNLKKDIVKNYKIYGSKNALKVLKENSPLQRSLAIEILKAKTSIVSFSAFSYKVLVRACEDLLTKKRSPAKVEQILIDFRSKQKHFIDDETMEVMDEWIRAKLEPQEEAELGLNTVDAYAKKINVSSSMTAAFDLESPCDLSQKMDKVYRKIKPLFATLLSPKHIWEVDSVSPDQRIKKALIEHADILVHIMCDTPKENLWVPDALQNIFCLDSIKQLTEIKEADSLSSSVINSKKMEQVDGGTSKKEFLSQAGKPEDKQFFSVLLSQFVDLKEINQDTVTQQLKALDDSFYKELDDTINNKVKEVDIFDQYLLNVLRRETNPDGDNISKLGYEFMKQYFAKISVLDKRRALSGMAQTTHYNSSSKDVFNDFMKSGGPLLQKFGQMTKFNDIKSNLNPIDEVYIKAELFKFIKCSQGSITKLEIIDSLGRASIGETFLVNMYRAGSDKPERVVLKLKRPGIDAMIAREVEILREVGVNIQGMELAINNLIEQVQKETDSKYEIRNIITAAKVYNNNFECIQSISQPEGVISTETCIVLNVAPGVTLNEFFETIVHKILHADTPEKFEEIGNSLQSVKKCIFYALVVWLQELLCRSGFYHGDVHKGNLMFSEVLSLMSFIDYGNANALTRPEQRALFFMFCSAKTNNMSLFLESLEPLLTPESQKILKDHFAELELELKNIMKIYNMTKKDAKGTNEDKSMPPFLELFTACNKKGIELPPGLLNVCRSMILQCQLCSDFNEIQDLLEDHVIYKIKYLASLHLNKMVFYLTSKGLDDLANEAKQKLNMLIVPNGISCVKDIEAADGLNNLLKYIELYKKHFTKRKWLPYYYLKYYIVFFYTIYCNLFNAMASYSHFDQSSVKFRLTFIKNVLTGKTPFVE